MGSARCPSFILHQPQVSAPIASTLANNPRVETSRSASTGELDLDPVGPQWCYSRRWPVADHPFRAVSKSHPSSTTVAFHHDSQLASDAAVPMTVQASDAAVPDEP